MAGTFFGARGGWDGGAKPASAWLLGRTGGRGDLPNGALEGAASPLGCAQAARDLFAAMGQGADSEREQFQAGPGALRADGKAAAAPGALRWAHRQRPAGERA